MSFILYSSLITHDMNYIINIKVIKFIILLGYFVNCLFLFIMNNILKIK